MATRRPKTPEDVGLQTKSKEISNLVQLPEKLNIAMPDVGAMAPSNWFTASANIPELTESDYNSQVLKIDGQKRSVEIFKSNAEIAYGLAQGANTMAKVGLEAAKYQVTLEQIKQTGVKLRNAQVATANEEINVSITAEAGELLRSKLAGAKVKTTNQGMRNDVDALEGEYLTALKPLQQQVWNQQLEQLKAKLGNAIGK